MIHQKLWIAPAIKTGFNLFCLLQSRQWRGGRCVCVCGSAIVQREDNFLTILLTKVLYRLKNQFHFINLTFSHVLIISRIKA